MVGNVLCAEWMKKITGAVIKLKGDKTMKDILMALGTSALMLGGTLGFVIYVCKRDEKSLTLHEEITKKLKETEK
jgi:hypothetical protein